MLYNKDSLQGWLPKNSFIMRKKRPVAAATTHRTVHVNTEGPEQSPLVFINAFTHDFGHLSGEVGNLLDKMIEAMGTTRAQVKVIQLQMDQSLKISVDLVKATQSEILKFKPRVVVLLGEELAQNLFVEGVQLICIKHPQELIQNPALKKQAWEELKKAVQILGFKK